MAAPRVILMFGDCSESCCLPYMESSPIGDLAIGDGRDMGRQWSQPTSAFVGCVKEECLRDLDYERERTGYWHFDLIVLHSVSR